MSRTTFLPLSLRPICIPCIVYCPISLNTLDGECIPNRLLAPFTALDTTPLAALTNEPAMFLIPFIIPLIRSAPADTIAPTNDLAALTAFDTPDVTALTTLLMPDVTALIMPLIADVIALRTLFQPFDTVLTMFEIKLEIALTIDDQMLDTVDAIELNIDDVVLDMLDHAELTALTILETIELIVLTSDPQIEDAMPTNPDHIELAVLVIVDQIELNIPTSPCTTP